jgi:HlyD family secretion protein
MHKLIRRILLLLFVAGLAGAIAYGMRPMPVEADLAAVERGAIRETVDQDGKTRIRERYVVSAPLAGRLLRIELKAGHEVEAGKTILATIEPRDPDLLDVRARQQAEANVKAAQARLEQAQPLLDQAVANLDYAQADLKRAEQARAANPQAISGSEIDNRQMMVRTREALVRSARHAKDIAAFELDQARAALVRFAPQGADRAPAKADDNRDGSTAPAPYPKSEDEWRFRIPSPINGRVLRVFQESSAVVTAGTPLLELGDPRDLEVAVDVLSRDAVKIKPGAAVSLEEWGGDKPLEGEVRLVEPSGFTKISTLGVEEQRVNVIIDLVDPPSVRQSLGDSFRVEARIVIAEAENVLKAPTSALFRVGNDWAVFRVENGTARQRVVHLGIQNGLEAEITQGLAEGDLVITHPGDNIADGKAVRQR